MSKQSKRKARHRRKKRDRLTWSFLCPNCGREDDGSPGAIMTQIADALNAAADYDMKLKVHRSVIEVRGNVGGGFVLPLKDGRWTARDQQYDRIVQVTSLDEDD